MPLQEAERIYVADDGVRIAFWLHRAARARGVLLFLHGAASNHTRWSEFLQHTALIDAWDTLRLDLRGHARSATRGCVDMARWCNDLAGILRAEGYSRAIIVGHSVGANLAAYCAAHRPHLAAGMVLIDPVQNLFSSNAIANTCVRLCAQTGALVFRALGAVGIRRRRLPELDLHALDRHARALIAHGRHEEMRRLYSSPWIDMKYMSVSNYLQDVAQALRPLASISADMPVLMLLSASDPAAMQRNHAYAQTLSRCRVVEFPVSHWILTEQLDSARTAVENWLESDTKNVTM